jgi:hypothetical protein
VLRLRLRCANEKGGGCEDLREYSKRGELHSVQKVVREPRE